MLIAIDEEGGDVTRLAHATGSPYPGNAALGAVDDTTLTRRVYQTIGAELAGLGINVDLAPTVDVNTADDNPIIGTRSFGADPLRVAAHSAAAVTGLQAAGVAACAKHFPGHGATFADSHFGLPDVSGDLEPHLLPFRAVHRGRGRLRPHRPHRSSPSSTSTRRRSADASSPTSCAPNSGSGGLVISDSMTMQAVAATYGLEAAGVRAIGAGVDMLCVNADIPTQLGMRDALVAAVRSGALTEDRLAEAAGRVDRLASLFPRPERSPTTAARAEPTPGVGMAAARRALIVAAADLPISGPVFLVELAGPRREWTHRRAACSPSPGGSIRTLDGVQLRGAAATAEALQESIEAAADRRLVVVVRDAYRDQEQRESLRQLHAALPDLVLVGVGMPEDQALAGSGGFLGTCGAAAVNLAAAAEAIVGRTHDGLTKARSRPSTAQPPGQGFCTVPSTPRMRAQLSWVSGGSGGRSGRECLVEVASPARGSDHAQL